MGLRCFPTIDGTRSLGRLGSRLPTRTEVSIEMSSLTTLFCCCLLSAVLLTASLFMGSRAYPFGVNLRSKIFMAEPTAQDSSLLKALLRLPRVLRLSLRQKYGRHYRNVEFQNFSKHFYMYL